MKVSMTELTAVLVQFNPWWRGESIPDLPPWRRAAFNELASWVKEPPAARAVLLSGARQVGKTTLLRQMINDLIGEGVPPSNIIYITFDHPLIKLAGIDAVLNVWREKEIISNGVEYLFVDEAQFVPDWGTWIKHQVDFFAKRRIIFTGSALPLIQAEPESNVGRTHTIRLATLSFYEFLQLRVQEEEYEYAARRYAHLSEKMGHPFPFLHGIYDQYHTNDIFRRLPELPTMHSLEELFSWSTGEFSRVSRAAGRYVSYFNDYLARGGFPQTTKISSITQVQALLREDIVDKVLKRDMTALFGVRRIRELEQTFLYLCMHGGGQLNMETLSGNLGVNKTTAKGFIELLESTHLIYRLSRFGYGKEVLRGRDKIYLADAAISPAVFLKGKTFLDNPDAFGLAVETTAFKHLYAHYPNTARFTYWLGKNRKEVDIIAEQAGKYVPFEIKQRTEADIKDCQGLLEFCQEKNVERAYIVTKSISQFGLVEQNIAPSTSIMKIPAPLFCYWLGALELGGKAP
ncbi:MAG: ATPase [Legionellaceae bacterium]|nr:ATPase [Legionellaceae bacterium]